jgi:hypothetical protein
MIIRIVFREEDETHQGGAPLEILESPGDRTNRSKIFSGPLGSYPLRFAVRPRVRLPGVPGLIRNSGTVNSGFTRILTSFPPFGVF